MLALLKLRNGQEVIGSVKEDLDSTILIEDPLQINYRLVSTQPMPTVSVSRYMPFAVDKTFAFDKKDLLHMVEPKPAMIDYYKHALNNYKQVIDKNVEEELVDATRPPDEYSSREDGMSDAYQALLERLNYKGPLN